MIKIFIFAVLISSAIAVCRPTYRSCNCNDMEMFEQCDYAQQQINTYVTSLFNYNEGNNNISLVTDLPHLECYKHINCNQCDEKYKFGDMCLNIDAYNACTSAESKLSNFINSAKKFIQVPESIHVPTFECSQFDNSNASHSISGAPFILLLLFCFMFQSY